MYRCSTCGLKILDVKIIVLHKCIIVMYITLSYKLFNKYTHFLFNYNYMELQNIHIDIGKRKEFQIFNSTNILDVLNL